MSDTVFPVTFDAAFAPETLSTYVRVTDSDRDSQIEHIDESGRDRLVVKEGQNKIRLITF